MKNYFYFLLAISVISCAKHSTPSEPTQELEIYDHAAVVSARKEASDIGTAILKKGGNAFDAMVATEFALAVAYPYAGNLGGGGFIGRYLVRNLTKKNYRCIITTRKTFEKGYLKTQATPGAIELLDWNPNNFSELKEAIKNSDVVINLIGILYETRKQKFHKNRKLYKLTKLETNKRRSQIKRRLIRNKKKTPSTRCSALTPTTSEGTMKSMTMIEKVRSLTTKGGMTMTGRATINHSLN